MEVASPEGDGNVRFMTLKELREELNYLHTELAQAMRMGSGSGGGFVSSFERDD